MANLNELVKERANLASRYTEIFQKHQAQANAELQPIQARQSEVQKEIDEILNEQAGVASAKLLSNSPIANA